MTDIFHNLQVKFNQDLSEHMDIVSDYCDKNNQIFHVMVGPVSWFYTPSFDLLLEKHLMMKYEDINEDWLKLNNLIVDSPVGFWYSTYDLKGINK